MQNVANGWHYSADVPKQPKISTVDVVARNLARLMEKHDLSQADLAKKSGVSQRTISNILNKKNEPGIDKLEKLAAVFERKGWHLQVPMPVDLVDSDMVYRVVEAMIDASADGREMITRVAEREATYNKPKP